MDFYNNFLYQCRKVGKSPYKVASELGFSSATASHWRKGSVPYAATINKLADYFDCAPEDLLNGKEKAAPTREDSPVWKTAMMALQDMSDDELIRVIAEAQKIKESRKGSE